MKLRAGLSTGEVEAGRAANVYLGINSRLAEAALAIVIGAQAITGCFGMWNTGATEPGGVKEASVSHTDQTADTESSSISIPFITTAGALPSSFLLPPLPRETRTETTLPTTTTLPVPETTTTTLPPPPPETTTTVPSLGCPDVITKDTHRIPVPEGYSYVCMGPNKDYDGMTFPGRQEMEVYYKDPDDSFGYMKTVAAHEDGHAWQRVTGIWDDSNPPGYWAKDPTTGEGYCQAIPENPTRRQHAYILAHQTNNPPFYCKEDLEKQADDFAFAYGFHEGNQRGTLGGAIAACQAFAEHGTDVCHLPPTPMTAKP
jgi:hypothetical protein